MSRNPHLIHQTIKFTPYPWQVDGIKTEKLPLLKVSLGRFPTPVHPVKLGKSFPELNLWIKRDDLSSCDLSGNKVRKLEYLLAEAVAGKYDSVVTIGGLQSNHARATAVAARQLGLEPNLILRTNVEPSNIDWTGNLLWNRAVGANIYTIHPSKYRQIGSEQLVDELSLQLKANGKAPYAIPMGGSNTLGSFGYMDCIQEILELTEQSISFDHIIFACGSGGTAAGIAIGAALSGLTKTCRIHGVGVCDSPEYFYDHIAEVAKNLEIEGSVKDWITIYNGQGLGYAKNTMEELSFLQQFSTNSGVVLDPVYSGKALFYLFQNLIQDQSVFQPDHKILFIHTGGTFGYFDKSAQLEMLSDSAILPMDISKIEF